MLRFVEGNEFAVRRPQKDGPEFNEFKGTGQWAKQEIEMSMTEVRVSAGRTVSLGNFEFARMNITMELRCPVENVEWAHAYGRSVVHEVLEREVASLGTSERQKLPLAQPPEDISGIMIGVEYGLTISLKKFESSKVDVGVTRPVTDGESIDDVVDKLQEYVGAKVKIESDKIRGVSADTGF